MRAVILSGGRIKDYEYVKKFTKNALIICADKGYNHSVKMGVKPHILIGDFDSVGSLPDDNNIEKISYPADKDKTDTHLALEYAFNRNFEEILIFGAIGSRMDHTLSNILMTITYSGKITVMDEHNKIWSVRDSIILHEEPGTIVSILPIGQVYGVTTSGLKYPLYKKDIDVTKEPSLGISNVMTEKKAEITVEKGVIIVMVTSDRSLGFNE